MKAKKEYRNQSVNFKITAKEKKQLLKNVKKSGLSITGYLVAKAIKDLPTVIY